MIKNVKRYGKCENFEKERTSGLYPETSKFFTNSQQYKNANIAYFILSVPLEMSKSLQP